MGYRSDVMALIYPDACASDEQMREKYDQLKVLMATTFKGVEEAFGDPYMTWHDAECVLKFNIEDVKWYSSNSEVQMFEEMLSTLRNSDPEEGGVPGYCTEFIRIGEDNNDVDEEHNGELLHYYLQVRRSIDCDI